MSEEYTDRELETVHQQVGGWFDGFVKSTQYDLLTETQKDKAPGIVRCFAEYSFRHIGVAPEKWNPGDLTECCLDILPQKISAGPDFFQALAPVLSAFFIFLAEKGLLSNARALARTVAELDKQIVAASQDEVHWGPAKAFAMAALKAGVDLNDRQAVDEFMASFNLQLMARRRPAPQAPFYPTPPFPAPVAPVRRSEPKVGRNDPCPCGSGKKFKKCCGH
jgi:hypothetical protein